MAVMENVKKRDGLITNLSGLALLFTCVEAVLFGHTWDAKKKQSALIQAAFFGVARVLGLVEWWFWGRKGK